MIQLVAPSRSFDPVQTLSVLRAGAGGVTWLSPTTSWRVFGLGRDTTEVVPSVAILGRLFGVRDAALAVAVRYPDPSVRTAALRIGVAVVAADVAATLLAVRAGAPRSTLVGVAAGAALFVGLGLAGLRRPQ